MRAGPRPEPSCGEAPAEPHESEGLRKGPNAKDWKRVLLRIFHLLVPDYATDVKLGFVSCKFFKATYGGEVGFYPESFFVYTGL